MIPALIDFLDKNKEFIEGFTPTQIWFIRLEDKLKIRYPGLYRNFFAEISFDILALREPEMAVITYDSDNRYSLGIRFSGTAYRAYLIFSEVIPKNTDFRELKERLKDNVKGNLLCLDKSSEIICDLIDSIPEERMVKI